MRDKGRPVILGGALILIGAWLLVRALGVDLPGWSSGWPVIIILGALVSLYSAFAEQPTDPENIWFGVAGLIIGSLFLYITLGAGEWSDMRELWPIFPAAAGLGWLLAWPFERQTVSDLVLGLAALTVGVLGYLYTQGIMAPQVGRQLINWWPLILVLIGVAYIIQYFIQER